MNFKKLGLPLFFTLLFSSVFTQYTDTTTMRSIENARAAMEGDLYLDTVAQVYKIGLTNGKLGSLNDHQSIDSLKVINDSLIIYLQNSKPKGIPLDSMQSKSWHKIGTNKSPTSINDSIYTNGLIQLTDYPNTRNDNISSYLNLLYTDNTGVIKSARREIIPPIAYINPDIINTGNSFDYYNFYATQITNVGLTPVPILNLDFYVISFDPTVFQNVSISTSGILTYDVIATSTTKSYIDVRFYTK